MACAATLPIAAQPLGCQSAEADSQPAPQLAPVSLGVVSKEDVPLEVRAIGTVEALNTVAIVPQVTGRVTAVEFEEGDLVERGDALFTIDTRPYDATLAAARAELQRAQALTEQAKSEAERYRTLAREGLVSNEEAARRQADAESSAAAAKVASAKIASASLNVQFSTIRSPISGRTGRLLVNAGNVVQENDPNPLVVIRTLSPVKVAFTINQELLPKLRERFTKGPLSVRATPRGNEAKASEGQLTFIDNSVDSETGTLTLKATFPNTQQELWPGSFVDVVLVLDVEKDVTVVPEAAVAEGQDGAYAFVVDDQNKAHFKRVTVHRRTATLAIVEEGLSPGERVVVDGLVRLKDGVEVSVKTDDELLVSPTEKPR